MRGDDVILPSRFLTALAHFILTILLFSYRNINVVPSVPASYTQAAYNSADSSMLAVLSLDIVCSLVEFASMLGGFTMFQQGIALWSTLANALISIFFSLFRTQAWQISTLWAIWGILSLPLCIYNSAYILYILLRHKPKY